MFMNNSYTDENRKISSVFSAGKQNKKTCYKSLTYTGDVCFVLCRPPEGALRSLRIAYGIELSKRSRAKRR